MNLSSDPQTLAAEFVAAVLDEASYAHGAVAAEAIAARYGLSPAASSPGWEVLDDAGNILATVSGRQLDVLRYEADNNAETMSAWRAAIIAVLSTGDDGPVGVEFVRKARTRWSERHASAQVKEPNPSRDVAIAPDDTRARFIVAVNEDSLVAADNGYAPAILLDARGGYVPIDAPEFIGISRKAAVYPVSVVRAWLDDAIRAGVDVLAPSGKTRYFPVLAHIVPPSGKSLRRIADVAPNYREPLTLDDFQRQVAGLSAAQERWRKVNSTKYGTGTAEPTTTGPDGPEL